MSAPRTVMVVETWLLDLWQRGSAHGSTLVSGLAPFVGVDRARGVAEHVLKDLGQRAWVKRGPVPEPTEAQAAELGAAGLDEMRAEAERGGGAVDLTCFWYTAGEAESFKTWAEGEARARAARAHGRGPKA